VFSFLHDFAAFLQTFSLTAGQVLQYPESRYLAAKWAVQHTEKAQVGTNFNGVIRVCGSTDASSYITSLITQKKTEHNIFVLTFHCIISQLSVNPPKPDSMHCKGLENLTCCRPWYTIH
jgi:hypothetical protein